MGSNNPYVNYFGSPSYTNMNTHNNNKVGKRYRSPSPTVVPKTRMLLMQDGQHEEVDMIHNSDGGSPWQAMKKLRVDDFSSSSCSSNLLDNRLAEENPAFRSIFGASTSNHLHFGTTTTATGCSSNSTNSYNDKNSSDNNVEETVVMRSNRCGYDNINQVLGALHRERRGGHNNYANNINVNENQRHNNENHVSTKHKNSDIHAQLSYHHQPSSIRLSYENQRPNDDSSWEERFKMMDTNDTLATSTTTTLHHSVTTVKSNNNNNQVVSLPRKRNVVHLHTTSNLG